MLALDVQKPVIKKFRASKQCTRFCAAHLAEMGLIYYTNWGVKYLLHVIDFSTKYGWVKPLKIKKRKTGFNDFIGIVNESKEHKPKKLWAGQGREFNINVMQKWLDDNDISMYLTHNEGQSVVTYKNFEGQSL